MRKKRRRRRKMSRSCSSTYPIEPPSEKKSLPHVYVNPFANPNYFSWFCHIKYSNALTNITTLQSTARPLPSRTSLCEFLISISRKKIPCHGHSRLHSFYLSVILTSYLSLSLSLSLSYQFQFQFLSNQSSKRPSQRTISTVFSSLGGSPLLLDLRPPGRSGRCISLAKKGGRKTGGNEVNREQMKVRMPPR